MMDVIFIILLLFAILLLFVVSQTDDQLWAFIFIIIDAVIWFILAAAVLEIEIPYQYVDPTTGIIAEDSHIFSSKISPYLVYLFAGFGSISVLISILILADVVKGVLVGHKKRH